MGAALIHSEGRKDGRIDGQTGKAKLLGAFRDYAKAPEFFYRETNSSGMFKFL
jgi:hypothetical protein